MPGSLLIAIAYDAKVEKAREDARGLETEVLQAYINGYEQNTSRFMRFLKEYTPAFVMNDPRLDAYRQELSDRQKSEEVSGKNIADKVQ